MTLTGIRVAAMNTQAVEQQARNYLTSNVPQIQQHGGNFEIREVDNDTGSATIAIGGACSGCGIAPMTMKAIERRLPEHVDDIETVDVIRAGGPDAAVMPSKTDNMEQMDEYEDYSPPF